MTERKGIRPVKPIPLLQRFSSRIR